MGIYHKDLESQRQRLVEKLIEYKKIKEHEITIVFDGWKSGSGQETHLVSGGVKIIYSMLGEKADHVIKKIISSDKKQWIVVSSDREISDHAWRNGSVALSSDEFLRLLEKADTAITGEFEFLDEEDELPKKGSPRKLSKKEKTKQRALNKL